jgi:hypothetical protein
MSPSLQSHLESTCPECGEQLYEHSPFDPELVQAGLFHSSWIVASCAMCGHLERTLSLPRAAEDATPWTRSVTWPLAAIDTQLPTAS